jgi:hypothetical protein
VTGAGATGAGWVTGAGAGWAGVGWVTGAGTGFAGVTAGAGGLTGAAGFTGFVSLIGAGCVTPGAGTPGFDGTGLKFASSGSGMPSAHAVVMLAATNEAMHAATAATTRNVIPSNSCTRFASGFAIH